MTATRRICATVEGESAALAARTLPRWADPTDLFAELSQHHRGVLPVRSIEERSERVAAGDPG
jgi:hypothetical protein